MTLDHRQHLQIVGEPIAVEETRRTTREATKPVTPPTRHQRAKALARAMARTDKLRAQLAQALAAEDAAFGPFAAGRSISRDQAREQLTSLGLLPEVER